MTHEHHVKLPKKLSGVMLIERTKIREAIAAREAEKDAPAPAEIPETPPAAAPVEDVAPKVDLAALQLEAILNQLHNKVSAWHHDLEARCADVQQFAIELSVLMAERLIHSEIARGTLPFEAIVSEAMRRLHPKKAVRVRLHPEDRALLEAHVTLAEKAAEFRDIHWVDDAQLARGECKVEADDVGVWSNWRRGLEVMKSALWDTP